MSSTAPQACSTGHRRLTHPITIEFRKYVTVMFDSLESALAPPDPNVEPLAPNTIQTPLYKMLREQLDAAPSYQARDLQLIMAGLTDDLFLNQDWYARSWWRNNPLEYRLFGTRSAGDSIFALAEKISNERDPESAPIAQVLIDTLALGFKGKYAGEGEEMPMSYLNGLHEVVQLGCPRSKNLLTKRIFAETYKSIFTPSTKKNLPALREWLIGAGVVAIVLLVVSHIVWSTATGPLDTLLHKLHH